ncbi:MAG: hypothetical protein IJR83_07750 [Clostridia bacterium]|nr:hypothetical protein [Clostridia bacterium]
MKRLIPILLAILMLFSLVSCLGESGNQSGADTDNGAQTPSGKDGGDGFEEVDVDFGSVMAGNGSSDIVYGQCDAATKAEIIAAGREAGVTVTFGADGSMTVVDEEGNTVKQNPDGTWVIVTADGTTQIGGNWPSNAFTEQIPKPSFALTATSTEEDEFTAAFQNVTEDQFRTYLQQIKDRGFTADAESTDMEVEGARYINYSAGNGKGYTVDLQFAYGIVSLLVSKDSE